MAEAIGLAFGGIALATLVSTCVEILEYTSNARYWLCDLNVAFTKVALLHCRLHHLQENPFVAAAIGHDKSGDTCDVATQGLSGVKSVLEQTNKLCRRYSLAHLEEGEHSPATHRSQDVQSSAQAAAYHLNQPQLVAVKSWRRLGRQLSWALLDKKKFDKLIADLDFLLSNTEQLLQMARIAAIQTCQPQKPAISTETLSSTSTSDVTYESDISGTTTAFSSSPSWTQLGKDSMSSRNVQVIKATTEKRRARSDIFSETPTESNRAMVISTVTCHEAPVTTTDDSAQNYSKNVVAMDSSIFIDVKNKKGHQRGGIVTENNITENSSISIGGLDPIAAKLELRKMELEAQAANRNNK